MSAREALINYLGAGISQHDAAEAAGVSDSYVSQLMSGDAEFLEAVRAKRASQVSRYVEMDNLADTTQHEALRRLSKVISVEARPQVLMAAINTLDKMQRRSSPAQAAQGSQAGLVQLVLPAIAAHKFTIAVDTSNRVIQIDDHTMVPASGAKVAQMAEVVGGHNHERAREAGVLSIAAGSSGGSEAHPAIPAPANQSSGPTPRLSRTPGRAQLDTFESFDGTLGSVL